MSSASDTAAAVTDNVPPAPATVPCSVHIKIRLDRS